MSVIADRQGNGRNRVSGEKRVSPPARWTPDQRYAAGEAGGTPIGVKISRVITSAGLPALVQAREAGAII